jgi:ATP-dependent RNA helicase DDX24/MAK5
VIQSITHLTHASSSPIVINATQHPGRCLLFVNSIKSARRIDALLRAMGVNCRTIHAQLQQRQRLRALDAFRAAPVGVLVATDVRALQTR